MRQRISRVVTSKFRSLRPDDWLEMLGGQKRFSADIRGNQVPRITLGSLWNSLIYTTFDGLMPDTMSFGSQLRLHLSAIVVVTLSVHRSSLTSCMQYYFCCFIRRQLALVAQTSIPSTSLQFCQSAASFSKPSRFTRISSDQKRRTQVIPSHLC